MSFLFDLSAAFDTIDYNTLIHRSEYHYNDSGNALAWISAYLSGRFQTLYVESQLSEHLLMKYKCSTGIWFGPKLFYHINKANRYHLYTSWTIASFYADDSQLYKSFKCKDSVSKSKVLRRIECCLTEIIAWMNANIKTQSQAC